MIITEIIAIGNEILIGDVLDTNTHWLCKQTTGIGGKVNRAALVRDELDAIVREVRSALERKVDVLFTSGGLGPTADDITLEGVARATDRPLELNPEARAFVAQKYAELARIGHVADASLTPAREKMAILPGGAVPLPNPLGAAPGVLLRVRHTTLVCLPGVQAELKAIFEHSLQPFLKAEFGESVFVERVALVNSNDESILAPILKAVADRHPEVYLKSRAKSFGPDIKFRVTVSAAGASKQDVERHLDSAMHDLAHDLGDAHIAIDSIES
jgi:nicotinamide-nucleotide amidase